MQRESPRGGCGRLNNAPTAKYVRVLIPRTCECYRQMRLCRVIKDVEIGRLPRVFKWTQCNRNSCYKRDTGGMRVRGEGDVMMEAEVEVMYFEGGGRSHKPRNVGGHQELKKAREWTLPSDPPERNQPF